MLPREFQELRYEIFQHKGSSGWTFQNRSGVFEYGLEQFGSRSFLGLLSREPEEDFLRYALTEGMVLESQGGTPQIW